MSDFLTRLIERTLGLAEVVQPLVSPVYSTGTIDKDDILSSNDDRTVLSEAHPLKAELLRKSYQPDQDSLHGKPVHEGTAETNKTDDYSMKEVENDTSSPEKSESDALAQPRKFIKHDEAMSEILQKPRLNIHAAEASDKTSTRIQDREILAVPVKTQINGRRQVAHRERTFKREFVFKKIPVSKVTNNSEPMKTSSVDRPFINMAVPEENTHIKISIGRVEVKAITPRLPARIKRTWPGPQLTLGDYLKQRNEGKR